MPRTPPRPTPRMSGSTLALGAMALLAGASYWRPRYGARSYSELQQQLLRVKNEYRHSPETVIRGIDMVLSLLPGLPTAFQDPGMPGVWVPNAELIDIVQREDPASVEVDYPDAGLPEYAELLVKAVREDNFTGYGESTLRLSTQTDQEGREIVWPYLPYVSWISKQVAALVRAKDRNKITEAQLFVRLREMKRQATHVLDWALGTNPALGNYTFETAKDAADEWHERHAEESARAANQRKRKSGEWFDSGDHDGQASQRGEVMYTFPNGWTVQRLTTPKQLLEEGNIGLGGGMLRHCIGTPSQPYVGQVRQGVVWADSLRTPDNRPWLTATTYTQGGDVAQVKGFKNRLPGTLAAHGGSEDSEIKSILLRRGRLEGYNDLDQILDGESLMMDTYFKAMGYKWNHDVGTAPVRLRRMANEKALAQRQGRAAPASLQMRSQPRPQARPQVARQQVWEQEEGGFNRTNPKKNR